MKRYISAILIPGLLLQLYGCYSLKESTLEELIIKKGGTVTTNDKSVYLLKQILNKNEVLNNPEFYFSDDWIINLNTEIISIERQRAYKINKPELEEDYDYGDWGRNKD